VARLAVVTSSPPSIEGGHLVIARALVRAAAAAGHQAALVVTPDFGFGRTASTYWANWRADLGNVDRVVSLRYPSYAVRHPAHTCWLNHTMREYYDLWPDFAASLSPLNRMKEGLRRRLIRAADTWLLQRNVQRLLAQSNTIRRRLAADFGITAEVLHPPPPQRAYRCDQYGDYIFAVSRLVPLKRVDLLVRALAEPAARHLTAVVAGDGHGREELARTATALGVGGRLSFLGRIDEAALLDHLARCRAVCFTPREEDYGFVTVEAFASRKPVVTCRDSGGPTDLVIDGDTGFVTEPTPAAIAAALVRLRDDRALAERMGARAAARVEAMTWQAAVDRLVI
jgi:glycosyltransferase involved in cell wall biosynthesis